MYPNKYKDILKGIQLDPNKWYKDMIRTNIFTSTPVGIINKETFEIDLFKFLETINTHSIILSRKHFILQSPNGELVWIDSYKNFENLFCKLEKFLNEKRKFKDRL